MHNLTARFLRFGLLVMPAFSQTVPAPAAALDRVFLLAQTDTPQNLVEIANIASSIADTRALLDRANRTLSVHDAPERVAAVEWLIAQLDRTAGVAPGPAPAVHPNGSNRGMDQVVRVFSLAHTETPIQLQELTNLIRSISDMQRVFPYGAQKMVVASGSVDQMAVAEWLVQQLDLAPGSPAPNAGTREIQWTFATMHTARVFFLTHDQTPAGMQAIIDQLRAASKVQRLIPYNARHAIAARGTAEEIAALQTLVQKLDR
jgi:type II secretory pathway component GspD/PulD (secretin)